MKIITSSLVRMKLPFCFTRVIIDGEGSGTVFNGETARNDMRYTRSNNYVAGDNIT